MTTKTDSTSTKIARRPRRSLLRDKRGASEITQMIILTVALALGCLAAVKALSGNIKTKMQQTGTDIQAISK